MERMFSFYTRVLCLKPVTDSKDADWRVLDYGSAELALHLMTASWGNQVLDQAPSRTTRVRSNEDGFPSG